MKKVFTKNQNQKGYAILFTLVIVSAVSVITAGLTNTIYKQMILSSITKDSQAAFYQADTASDCALYADSVEYKNYLLDPETSIFSKANPANPWPCGGMDLVITPTDGNLYKGYDLKLSDETSSDPCFSINVEKVTTGNGPDMKVIKSTITAKGYNICDKKNSRTVERAIEIVIFSE